MIITSPSSFSLSHCRIYDLFLFGFYLYFTDTHYFQMLNHVVPALYKQPEEAPTGLVGTHDSSIVTPFRMPDHEVPA